MYSDRLSKKIARLLIREPHLTRSEAIRFLQSKNDAKKKVRQKSNQKVKKENIKGNGKSSRSRQSVYTVSGGKVSPR